MQSGWSGLFSSSGLSLGAQADGNSSGISEAFLVLMGFIALIALVGLLSGRGK